MSDRFSSLCIMGTLVALPTLLSAQWVQTSAPSAPVIDVSSAGSRLFLASRQEGVYTSTDEGASWAPRNNNLLLKESLWHVSVFGDTVYAVSGALQKMHVNDTTWSGNYAGNSTRNAIDVSGATIHVGYLLTGGIQRSTDAGGTWSFATIHQPPALGFGFSQAFLNTGTALLVGHNFGIHRSTDGGATWDSVLAASPASSILCFLNHSSGLFAGGISGASQILLQSTNNGVTWTSVLTTGMLAGNGISSLASSGQYLFAVVVGRGVYVSRVSPINWTLANTGLTSANLANTIVIMNNNVYLASGSASTGFGVWKRPVSQLTAVLPDARDRVPTTLVLHQNYPNPFNPGTTISYQVPVTSHVYLSVHDMLGRKIAVLVNERREAGAHEVKFEGSNLASGVYIYRLQAGDRVQTKTLVLLK